MGFTFLLAISSALGLKLQAPSASCANPVPNSIMPAGFCAEVWYKSIRSPRGLYVNSKNEVLVVSTATSSVYVTWDDNNDGVPDGNAQIAKATGLTHALNVHGGYLYASSDSTVFRWKYTDGTRTDLGTPEVFVKNVPRLHHVSRVMVFDREGRMYVHSGSEENVAVNDSHSRIHRFDISGTPPAGGFDWNKAEFFAGGLRNECGLRFDEQDRLWGVENGRDDLNRQDLGGDIHNDNPAEEINLFDKNKPGKFYGYPYCWSAFKLTGYTAGTQFADPTFPTKTDTWCRNTDNVVPPAAALQAHMAPLDIFFWPTNTTWPADYKGSALVSYHGSWNRNPPSGYLVELVKVNGDKVTSHTPFLGYSGAPIGPPRTWIRPVALGRIKCPWGECLLVTSDTTNSIIIVSYRPTADSNSGSHSTPLVKSDSS